MDEENFIYLNGINKKCLFDEKFWKDDQSFERFFRFLSVFQKKNKGLTMSDKGTFLYKSKYMNGITRRIDEKIGKIKKTSASTFTEKCDTFVDVPKYVYPIPNVTSSSSGNCTNSNRMKHGSLIDRELYHFVHHEGGVSSIQNLANKDPCTIRFIEFMNSVQWKCVFSQTAIVSLSRGLATSLDMICYKEREDQLLVLEIKTTPTSIEDENYQRQYTSFMKFPKKAGGFIPHTVYLHNQVQLHVAKKIFEESYLQEEEEGKKSKGGGGGGGGRIPIKIKYYLIRIHRDGVVVYPEYGFSKQQSDSIMRRIQQKKTIKKIRYLAANRKRGVPSSGKSKSIKKRATDSKSLKKKSTVKTENPNQKPSKKKTGNKKSKKPTSRTKKRA